MQTKELLNLPHSLILFLGIFLLVNIGQAFFTELLHDEAYYWYYAQNLAWGYFDHPPMVAWMIALGNQIFQGEMGVRLISCLMGTGTLFLLWKLIDRETHKAMHLNLFVWLGSIVLVHAYGFLSLPDTPLIFFTALFLRVYQKFIKNPNALKALFLGLIIAALMYSKYHAALVILFVVISNPGLLKNKLAWFALLVSLLAYFPHLYWLYEHDFVSIRYHITERPNQMYTFDGFTLGYILNLLALFGLTFPWVYLGLIQFRPQDKFERALVFTAYGILLFFFISSFQRRVQTQWLIAACIPIAVIIGRQLLEKPVMRVWLLRMGIANLLILGVLRVGLIYEPLFPVQFETHGNKRWVGSLQKVSDGAPVVFENSYRLPSVYSFYSRQPSFTLINTYYRHNQYSLDNAETFFQGKRVFYVPIVNRETSFAFENRKGEEKFGYFIPNFISHQKITAGLLPESPSRNSELLDFWIYNPYDSEIILDSLQFGIAYLDTYKKVMSVKPVVFQNYPERKILKERDSISFTIRQPKIKNAIPAAYMRAVVAQKGYLWGLNGESQKISP